MVELEFNKERIATMTETEALRLHGEAAALEKQAHQIRRLAWERVQQIRQQRTALTPEQRERRRIQRAEAKAREREQVHRLLMEGE